MPGLKVLKLNLFKIYRSDFMQILEIRWICKDCGLEQVDKLITKDRPIFCYGCNKNKKLDF